MADPERLCINVPDVRKSVGTFAVKIFLKIRRNTR